MKCEICHMGPPNGPSIYRVNKPGELPARWRCKEHLNDLQKKALDPTMVDIVQILEQREDSNEVGK